MALPPILEVKQSSYREEMMSDSSSSSSGSSGSDSECRICLGKLKIKSFSDSCTHNFCFNCLIRWSKVKPECPLCKKSFKSIIYNVRSPQDYDLYQIPERPRYNEYPSLNTPTIMLSDIMSYRVMVIRESESAVDLQRSRSMRSPIIYNQIPSRGMDIEMDDSDLPDPFEVIDINEYLGNYHRSEVDLFSHPEIPFRQMIYRDRLWVNPVLDVGGATRESNPHYYRENPMQVMRLRPWLLRELVATVSSIQAASLTEQVSVLLTQVSIESSEMRALLGPWLGSDLDHFLHEFRSFATSYYDMAGFDENAEYPAARLTARYENAEYPAARPTARTSGRSVRFSPHCQVFPFHRREVIGARVEPRLIRRTRSASAWRPSVVTRRRASARPNASTSAQSSTSTTIVAPQDGDRDSDVELVEVVELSSPPGPFGVWRDLVRISDDEDPTEVQFLPQPQQPPTEVIISSSDEEAALSCAVPLLSGPYPPSSVGHSSRPKRQCSVINPSPPSPPEALRKRRRVKSKSRPILYTSSEEEESGSPIPLPLKKRKIHKKNVRRGKGKKKSRKTDRSSTSCSQASSSRKSNSHTSATSQPGSSRTSAASRPGSSHTSAASRPGSSDTSAASRPGSSDTSAASRPGSSDTSAASRPGSSDTSAASQPGSSHTSAASGSILVRNRAKKRVHFSHPENICVSTASTSSREEVIHLGKIRSASSPEEIRHRDIKSIISPKGVRYRGQKRVSFSLPAQICVSATSPRSLEKVSHLGDTSSASSPEEVRHRDQKSASSTSSHQKTNYASATCTSSYEGMPRRPGETRSLSRRGETSTSSWHVSPSTSSQAVPCYMSVCSISSSEEEERISPKPARAVSRCSSDTSEDETLAEVARRVQLRGRLRSCVVVPPKASASRSNHE